VITLQELADAGHDVKNLQDIDLLALGYEPDAGEPDQPPESELQEEIDQTIEGARIENLEHDINQLKSMEELKRTKLEVQKIQEQLGMRPVSRLPWYKRLFSRKPK